MHTMVASGSSTLTVIEWHDLTRCCRIFCCFSIPLQQRCSPSSFGPLLFQAFRQCNKYVYNVNRWLFHKFFCLCKAANNVVRRKNSSEWRKRHGCINWIPVSIVCNVHVSVYVLVLYCNNSKNTRVDHYSIGEKSFGIGRYRIVPKSYFYLCQWHTRECFFFCFVLSIAVVKVKQKRFYYMACWSDHNNILCI